MIRFALTLVVGLMLSVSGSAWADIPAHTLREIKSSCSSNSLLGPAKVLKCENERKEEYLAVINQPQIGNDIPAHTLREIKSSCSSNSVLGPAKVLKCENERKQEYLAVINQPQIGNDIPAYTLREIKSSCSSNSVLGPAKVLKCENERKEEYLAVINQPQIGNDIPAYTLREIESSCNSNSVLGPAKVLKCENERKQEYVLAVGQQIVMVNKSNSQTVEFVDNAQIETKLEEILENTSNVEIRLSKHERFLERLMQAGLIRSPSSINSEILQPAFSSYQSARKDVNSLKILLPTIIKKIKELKETKKISLTKNQNRLERLMKINADLKFRFLRVEKRYQTVDALLRSESVQVEKDLNEEAEEAKKEAELLAAQRKAEELEQRLAALEAQQQQQQRTISQDTQIPLIDITSVDTVGKQGIIKGKASDNTGIAEVTVDGIVVPVNASGIFEYSTFVPSSGLSVTVQATDLAGLTSIMSVTLERTATSRTATIRFDRLNPLGKPVTPNKDALAFIIGIGAYENTDPAKYADSDALMFEDYASEKLGVPEERIKTLVNGEADIAEILLSIKKWLRRSTKPDKTDIYVFFAGHGLAAPEGQAYLIPFDGRPELELLERTALLQKELFEEIAAANPRNVTVFLDACYTGKTRTGELLLADANYRPLVLKAIDDGMPDNFTLMTASSGSEFSGPLEEAKHGMFSYFLMKGMEGEADTNQDNKITAGELHAYVERNVDQQSSGRQTPELQGVADRVLVQFK